MRLIRLLTILALAALLAACESAGALPTETAPPPTEPPSATPAPTEPPTTTPPPTQAPTEEDTPMPGTGTADADVTFVQAEQSGDGTWTFRVTVEHPDTGWEDYADGWDVVLPDGTVLKPDADSPFTRLLLHPHVEEQPFTRSQSSIEIPEGITTVTVRAHDLVDGFGGQEVTVDLTQAEGENYEVITP